MKPTLGGIASDVGQGSQWCLACLQLQKLKVFALPPLSPGLSFLSPAHQPPPKIAPRWNTLCECEDEAWGFGVWCDLGEKGSSSVRMLTSP